MGGGNELVIKNFEGLNLRDAADKVKNEEWTQLQNCWQPSKGIYSPVFGQVIDIPSASIPYCSRISGVWRHYSPNGKRFSLYHCVPDGTLLPDNTTDLTLAEVAPGSAPSLANGNAYQNAPGNIFGGGSIVTLRVCYSWIGRGLEQTYNSKNRTGFPSVGAFPLAASSNPAHQTITMGTATNYLKVTIPAFPAGVTGANIFVARGSATQMTYMGTVSTSAGSLYISEFIAPIAVVANADPMTGAFIEPTSFTGANLPPGTYYVAMAYVTDPNVQEGKENPLALPLQTGTTISTIPTNFGVTASGANTPGGATLSPSTAYDIVVGIGPSYGSAFAAFGNPLPSTPFFNGTPFYFSSVVTVTTGSGDNSVKVNLPPLPSGVDSNSVYTVYIGLHGGTLYAATSAGTISYLNLQPGTSVAIIAAASSGSSPGVPTAPNNPTAGPSNYVQQITLTGGYNAISVTPPAATSAHGGQALYLFIGTQDPRVHPLTCVGIIRCNTVTSGLIGIGSIPSHNAQTAPQLNAPDINPPIFWNGVNDGYIGGRNYLMGSKVKARFGFLISKDDQGNLNEVYPSRTLTTVVSNALSMSVYAGDNPYPSGFGSAIDLHNFAPQPRTQNDSYASTVYPASSAGFVQPYVWNPNIPVTDPSFCYNLGLSYFVNGVDIPWQTDGYTLSQLGPAGILTPVAGQPNLATQLPPIGRHIFVFLNSLVIAGAQSDNQLYSSNANQPQNWAAGGSGTALRFVTIGDAVGSGIAATGIYTPASEATSNPGSFMIGFKKNGTWMTSSIPDPTTSSVKGAGAVGASMVQVSGRVGCVASRSIVQTPLGTIFMGQDANIYMINRVAEPSKIGTKVQNGLLHLVGNDAAMRSVTASYHQNHYKLSFPSAAAAAVNPIINDSEFWCDLRTEDGENIRWNGPHTRKIGAQIVLVGDQDDESRLCVSSNGAYTFTTDDVSSRTDVNGSGGTVPIVQQMTSKIFRFQAEAHDKRHFGAEIDAYVDDSYTNNLLYEGFADSYYQSVNRNISNGNAVWDVSQWDQSNFADAAWQGLSLLFGQTNLIGRTFQFRITKSDPAPFALASVTLLMKTEKRRKIS